MSTFTQINAGDKGKITALIEEEIKTPLDVYDTDLFIQILQALN